MKRRDFIRCSAVIGSTAVLDSCALSVSRASGVLPQMQDNTSTVKDIAVTVVSKDEWMKHMMLKNQFGHYPEDRDIFMDYFDFCINSGKESENDGYVEWFQEAETILDIYSEKCEYTQENFDFILSCRNNLDNAIKAKFEDEDKQEEAEIASAQKKNEELLKILSDTKVAIETVSSRSVFDEYISTVEKCETELIKEYFSDEQEATYNVLVKDYSSVVSTAMARVTHNEDVQYNRNAVKSFKDAYDHFKADEKNQKRVNDEFRKYYRSKLFGFEQNRLFPETQQYFNLVYSYIFSKMKEGEDQYQFALMSIN